MPAKESVYSKSICQAASKYIFKNSWAFHDGHYITQTTFQLKWLKCDLSFTYL